MILYAVRPLSAIFKVCCQAGEIYELQLHIQRNIVQAFLYIPQRQHFLTGSCCFLCLLSS